MEEWEGSEASEEEMLSHPGVRRGSRVSLKAVCV